MSDKVNKDEDHGTVRVLVYGTLKNGHSNYYLMENANAKFIGYDSITDRHELFDLGAIPAVVHSANADVHKIRGELYSINTEGLAALDMLEGHPNLYKRTKHFTDLHNKRAWVYRLVSKRFRGEHAPKIPSGIWKGSQEENKFWLKAKSA